jgi:hypothetical protein
MEFALQFDGRYFCGNGRRTIFIMDQLFLLKSSLKVASESEFITPAFLHKQHLLNRSAL